MERGSLLSAGSIASGLTAADIRQRLTGRPFTEEHGDVHTAQTLGDASDLPRPVLTKTVPAAVLIPLVDHPTGLTVLLTRRTAHLDHHAGQISFPGGRVEEADADPVATALRETQEEIGLDASHIEIIGRLDGYMTITHFAVVPVVAVVRPPFDLKPDPFEVDEVFEVPFSFILDPANHQRHFREGPDGKRRYFYAIPYGPHYIWGATAAMLVNLAEALRLPS